MDNEIKQALEAKVENKNDDMGVLYKGSGNDIEILAIGEIYSATGFKLRDIKNADITIDFQDKPNIENVIHPKNLPLGALMDRATRETQVLV